MYSGLDRWCSGQLSAALGRFNNNVRTWERRTRAWRIEIERSAEVTRKAAGGWNRQLRGVLRPGGRGEVDPHLDFCQNWTGVWSLTKIFTGRRNKNEKVWTRCVLDASG